MNTNTRAMDSEINTLVKFLEDLLEHRKEARRVLLKKNGSKKLLREIREMIKSIEAVLEDFKEDPLGSYIIFKDTVYGEDGAIGKINKATAQS